jgi:hypothetical protein
LIGSAAASVPALATTAGTPSGTSTAASTPDHRGAPGTDCAWPIVASPDGANTFFPDSSATYWIQPYDVADGTTITLDGTFPDSRYAQFATYTSDGNLFSLNGLDSAIRDFQIQPDAGGVNPFAEYAEPGDPFTLTISPDAAAGDVNTLPMAPEGTQDGDVGILIYRIYKPADADFSHIQLPKVSTVQDGVSTPLPECDKPTGFDDLPEEVIQQFTQDAAGEMTAQSVGGEEANGFARELVGGLFPNADSGYVQMRWRPDNSGDVTVVRGKAPTSTDGDEPQPWPDEDTDIRYWSMCTGMYHWPYPTVVNELPDGETSFGCASDDATKLDQDGYYTYVIGTEDQRKQIEKTPSVTFLPTSDKQPHAEHIVFLRNMLPADEFDHAVQNVPDGSNPATAEQIMGDYYPHSGTCSLKELTKNGAQACLTGA